MGDYIVGVITGVCFTVMIYTSALCIVFDTNKQRVKYIKCGIGSYNTTSGAFEFKPQYKILGE